MALLGRIVAWSLRNRAVVLVGDRCCSSSSASAPRSTCRSTPSPTSPTSRCRSSRAAPALSPVEVEQYVTVPVERAMAGHPARSTEVRSISKYGLSVVTVVFDDGTDIYFARQLVHERMREAEDAVPAAVRQARDGADHHGPRRDLPVRRARARATR